MTEVLPTNDSFPDRVRTLVKLFGSRDKLGQAIGVSAVMIGKYEAGAEPSRDKLLALSDAAGVSIEWLVSGRGSMNRPDVMLTAEDGSRYAVECKQTAMGRRGDDVYCYIPLYDVGASAGGGAVVDQERVLDFLSFRTEWIRTTLHATPTDLYLIHVEGESMEPTLRPGDVILVDHREASDLPRDGIYVMRMDGTLLVKRLQRLPGGVVKVTSDNVAYEPFTVSLGPGANEVSIIGRVVWCGRRM